MTFWGNQDFFLEVAQDNIEGVKMFEIPGRRDGLSAVGLDDITQIPSTGLVIPNPDGQQLEVFSSNAQDTAAGTGVQTLEIEFLDSSGAEQVETIVMNGTSPVATASTDIDRVQWIHGITVGSNAVAEGNITLRQSTAAGGEIYEYVASGGNQSLSARYTVPAGKTGYVMGWHASAIVKIIDFRLRATVDRFTRNLQDAFNFQDAMVLDDAPSGWIPFNVPRQCPATSQIKVSGVSQAAGGDAGCQFDVLLIDDNVKVKPRTTRLR